jgi:hypothetical protein
VLHFVAMLVCMILSHEVLRCANDDILQSCNSYCTNCLSLVLPAVSSQWGVFNGEVVTKWLKDGRRMLLIQDFSFIDSSGLTWLAPKGTVVDGASIPKPFWSVMGGPFEGQYRNARVIHDHYCETWKTHGRSWQSVHKVFYYAMLAAGVPESKAIAMYIAVRQFGPRWRQPGEVLGWSGGTVSMLSKAAIEEVRMREANNITKPEVERIERLGIELASKGTHPSPEVIDRAFYVSVGLLRE